MRKMSVYDFSVIELSRNQDRAGKITPVSNNLNLPFIAKRIFYLLYPWW